MADPKTGGAITGGNWGYKGTITTGENNRSSQSHNSNGDSIDLGSFVIETELNNYEGQENNQTSAVSESQPMYSPDYILSLGRGPLNPDIVTPEMVRNIQIENAKAEKRKRLKAAGYNERDINRVMNNELTEAELYQEIFQEYVNGDDTRMRPILEATVIGEYFHYDRKETEAQLESYKEELEYLESDEFALDIEKKRNDIDMYTTIAEGCKAAELEGKESFIYVNSEGKEVIIPVTQAEYFKKLAIQAKNELELYEGMKNSTGVLREEIAALEAKLADDNAEEFCYNTMEEIDRDINELDSKIRQLEHQRNIRTHYLNIEERDFYNNPQLIISVLEDKIPGSVFKVINYKKGIRAKNIVCEKNKNRNTYAIKDDRGRYYTLEGKLSAYPIEYSSADLAHHGWIPDIDHNEECKTRSANSINFELSSLYAEKRKLEEKKKEIGDITAYYLEYGVYLFQPDFEENSKPKEREKMDFTCMPRDIFEYFFDAGAPYRDNINSLKDQYGDNGYLAYLIYEEFAHIDKDSQYGYPFCFYYYRNEMGVFLRNYNGDYSVMSKNDVDLYNNFLSSWHSVMTETEIKIFMYICNQVSFEKGMEYLRSISGTLDLRYHAVEHQKEIEWSTSNPVLASIQSVFLKPIEGMSAFYHSMDAILHNSPIYRTNIISRADWEREAVGAEIAKSSNVLAFLYGTGMSIADTGLVIALTAASGGSYGFIYTAMILGSSVYVTTLNDAKDRGFGDTEAVAMAVLFSTVEIVMESYSLSHLFKLDMNYSTFLGRFKGLAGKIANLSPKAQKFVGVLYHILSQSFTEMDEELCTNILDRGIDYVMGEVSDTGMNMFEYDMHMYMELHPGCTEEEAYQFAMGQFWTSVRDDALGGLFSGGFYGSFAGAHFSHNSDLFIQELNRFREAQLREGNKNGGTEIVPTDPINNTDSNADENASAKETTSIDPATGLQMIQVEQINTYIKNGDLNSLVAMAEQNPNDVVLNNVIQTKMGEYIADLDTESLTNLLLNNDFNEKTTNMVVQVMTHLYKNDGTGFKADMEEVYEAIKSKYPQAGEFFKFNKDNNSQWYLGQENKFETWTVLQYLQAQKLGNNANIDMLNLLNEQFELHGLPTYDNAIDAYFATLALCCNIRQQIYALSKKNTELSKKLANQLMQEYLWLHNVTREIALRNGHSPEGIDTVSFFQSSNSCNYLLGEKHDVGRADTTSAFNGGTACCNVEAVDSWIMQEMETLLSQNPNATAAEIEKLFIDGYFDYAALQNIEEWEKGYYRAIASNVTGNLDTTAGLHNSCFDLEWCLGGETLGMQEEFMLKHGKLTPEQAANLSATTPTIVPIYDQSGKQIGYYELKYCTGLRDTLGEMYTSGRMTEEEKAKIAAWYKTIYGTDINTDYH